MADYFIAAGKHFTLEDHAWDGYTLVLPCVSVGNVPQLVVDLFVKTYKVKDLRLVGYIKSNYVYPFAGPSPFEDEKDAFATSIEVHASPTLKLVMIQQRSHLYKEYRKEFYRDLFGFLGGHAFNLVLVLTSSFDHFLHPELNTTPNPIKYVVANDSKLATHVEETLGLSKIVVDGSKITLPGGGSARAYYDNYKKLANIRVLMLCIYCSEGDNRQHAFKFADCIVDVLKLENANIQMELNNKSNKRDEDGLMQKYNWMIPFSWRTLFGKAPPPEIY